jgi:glucose-6-phosphate 1-dehydrogenase
MNALLELKKADPAATLRSGISVSRVMTKEELCLFEQVASPCGIVIFGASGDLVHRKLLPSLFTLAQENLLPKQFYILGVARSPLSDAQFQAKALESLGASGTPAARADFVKHCGYHSGEYDDPKTYEALGLRLTRLDQTYETAGRRLFYLSTPPILYAAIAGQLGARGLAKSSQPDSWVRIVFEKPFGSSLDTAIQLNRALGKVFDENQIYRIDHYLGKETVQNILMFRFANAIYEPVWNNHYIDHVQITAAESDGVEHRAGYYEQAGALRDMFQNHLFQLLSLVAMEPPASMAADAVRNQKSQVLESLCFPKGAEWRDSAVRGQYTAGPLNGQNVPGYRQEPGVQPTSTTETYAALKVQINNWRWHGVPFYLQSGKRMTTRTTDIRVVFKHVPASVFQPLLADQISPNILHFRIQPDEGIALRFEAKHPGPKFCMSSVTMHFDYKDAFGVRPPEAYARLFHDVMIGDQTLFSRQDWLEHSWRFMDPILEGWKNDKQNGLAVYPAGSWGPPEAGTLLEQDGRQWLNS